MNINKNYLNLNESYLFSTIAKKVNDHVKLNPQKKIIRLGIGDVTRPLVPVVVSAMAKAVMEMGDASTFKGYGEEQGYLFLRKVVTAYYRKNNVSLNEDEIFISDGAKSDLGNILDIFSVDNTVFIPNPVYPVYVDTNIMAGRRIEYINGNMENNFLPMPDNKIDADIIYLCSPNNPSGAVYSKAQLTEWVNYALNKKAIILFDSAYEIFVKDRDLPVSIFQIDGADECAIEFCSLSKTAGFTGTRCGYTVIPNKLIRNDTVINKLWLRRQTTKFNGVPYIVQRGAEAALSEEGIKEIKKDIDYYLSNAKIITETLGKMGIWYTGGKNSPYIWMQCPNGLSSWDFFDQLLEKTGIVGTPGAGFGEMGEGFFRLSSFGSRENVTEAMERITKLSAELSGDK